MERHKLRRRLPAARIVPYLLLVTLLLTTAGCVKEQTITRSEAIPYKTKTINDSSLIKGVKKYKQKGIAGLRQVVYKEKVSGDEVVSRRKISDKIVAEPRQEIVRIGTAEPVGFIAIAGPESFQLTLTSYNRETTRTKDNKGGDLLRLNGTIKNNSSTKTAPRNILDIAAIHPTIKGGLSFLVLNGPPQVEAGQTVAVYWLGPLNPGQTSPNQALSDLSQLQLLPRLFVGRRNKLTATPKPLDGLPRKP